MPEAKILVVEDEKALAKVLKYNLEKEGYRVITAHDGDAGLDLFLEEKPDLVILDIMLPKKDGLTICRELRAKKVNMPIIMLEGSAPAPMAKL